MLFFWILDIWNVDLPVGEAVVRTLIKILMVVLICYVAWGLINAAIMRRMRLEVPEADDEQEEGVDFVHRNVTVYMPPDTASEASGEAAGAEEQSAESDSDIRRQAAAAAIQAEEEKKMAAAKKPEK